MKPRNFLKILSVIACVAIINSTIPFRILASQSSGMQGTPQTSFEDPESKKYKSLFQRLKDLGNSAVLKINILGRLTDIRTTTACDPQKITQLSSLKGALTSGNIGRASCTCCIAKEIARRETYTNAVSKCQNVSKYCPSQMPFRNESEFFNQTQLLSLNQEAKHISKIKVSEPLLPQGGLGIQDIEHLRYLWNLPQFYVSDQFTPQSYNLKFLMKQGYITPNPLRTKTSTNPYNHHYNSGKGRFFNPWPNAAPPDPVVNAASGIFGSLDVKKALRPWIPQRSYTTQPPAFVTQGIRATYIGHATVLIQVDGMNILTDPVYFDIGLGKREDKGYKFYKRIKSPGIPFEKLPQIHCILISHNHFDHFDIPSLKKIEAMNPNVIYITPLGYTKFLRDQGINTQGPTRIFELDWWDSIDFPKIRFTSLPTQHWCGRSVDDVNLMLWSAYAITTRPRGPNAKYIYFAGDTGFGPHFEEIAKKFRNGFDLALLPLGAYCPMHKEGGGHINPYEAARIHQILNAKQSMGIHFDTFQLAQEPYGEAARTLDASKFYYGIPAENFIAPDSAESIYIDEGGRVQYKKNAP
ncbi:MAG: MBL fold metallo-hydrolase [Alphaproteobacteria bacterium]|jgi:N-acyl-phosphatidylethanolamine-hydrolysing phospholipase D|nr:MBL fold metallo-hydrolase [Alphaproteobacteria bacterium]